MALTVRPEHASEVEAMLASFGFTPVSLGEIRKATDPTAEPEVLY